MLQTFDSSSVSHNSGPRLAQGPAAGRAAPAQRLLDLADADEFRRLSDRRALRCRRDGQELSALTLWLPRCGADPLPALWEACARRLCARVRISDIVTGWQASHFGILLPGCRAEHAPAVLRRLLQAAEDPYSLDGQQVRLRLQGAVMAAAPG